MGEYSKLTDEQKVQYRNLFIEIAKSEANFKKINKELKETLGINYDKVKDGLSKVGDIALNASEKIALVTAPVDGALAGVVAAGVIMNRI